MNEDQNEKSRQTISNRGPINLRVSFPARLVSRLSNALDFVLCKLDFTPLHRFNFGEILEGEPARVEDINGNILTLTLNIIKEDTGISNIIFHTDDCLRDYHKYIVSGVEFIKRPEYTSAGLQVEFIGNDNEQYTLLEERVYTD